MTSTRPPKATIASTSARGLSASWNSHAPTGTIKNGAHDPISAALATLLCVAPAKKTARLSPKNSAGTQTRRTSAHVTRRPVLQSTAFQATLTTSMRQKATSTPGVSARLTSVELSENATTSPSTARTPSDFALSARRRAGDPVGPRAACETASTSAPYPGCAPPSARAGGTAARAAAQHLADGPQQRLGGGRRLHVLPARAPAHPA